MRDYRQVPDEIEGAVHGKRAAPARTAISGQVTIARSVDIPGTGMSPAIRSR